MKKILLALALVVTGIVLAALVLNFRTDTLVVERDTVGVPVIEISGALDQAGARKIIRALRRAESSKPAFVVISFDSPGGEVSGILQVADAISGLSVRVVGLVKEGVSGTVFMIAACDRIYFTPKGVCGAASFIMLNNEPQAAGMFQKVQTYIGSKVKGYAEANGHDADIFLAMTDPGTELIRGEKVWKKRGELLTLTATEALAIGLSAGTFGSPEDILAIRKKIEAKTSLPTGINPTTSTPTALP